jgi:hypothetical protein
MVDLRSAELIGHAGVRVPIPLAEYRAAAPDPLWRVLSAEGVAAVRLGFPDGPVDSLQDVPASIRTALTCRCESARRSR